MYNSFNPLKKIKVAIVTNIPTFYRKKQWEYYSSCEYLDITVFYCANIENDRYWEIKSSEGIKEVFLKGLSYKSYHFNPGILKILLKDFDIICVGGFAYPSLMLLITSLKILNKPWIMIIDGISPLKIGKENLIFRFIKSFFIKGANAYFANGSISAKFLESYGITLEKIFDQHMTVDVDYFMEKEVDSLIFRSKLRKKHGIPDDATVIMYAGRLVKSKGVQDLIEAVKQLKNETKDLKILIVGEGNYKKELMKISNEIRSDVIYCGHINPENIYKYYYASDVLVLPTYDDPWGLVVNEAMACALPIIVTDAAGCSLDLVKNNGFIVGLHELNELKSAIQKISTNPKKFANNSRKLILKWTYKESLKNFIRTLKFCLEE